MDTEKVVVSIFLGGGVYTTEKKSVSEVRHILFPEIEAIRQHHAPQLNLRWRTIPKSVRFACDHNTKTMRSGEQIRQGPWVATPPTGKVLILQREGEEKRSQMTFRACTC